MAETRIGGPASLVDAIFPDAILKITSEQLKEIVQITALRSDDEWVSWPAKNATTSVPDLTTFISLIRDEVKARFLPDCNPRYCSSMFNEHPVPDPGCGTALMPSIVLLRSLFEEFEERGSTDWLDIEVVVEVVPEGMLSKGVSRCSRYCERSFACQPCPRFVPAVVIAGPHLTLIIFDRSGLVTSEKISVHDNPQKFLRLIIGLLYADLEHLGFETAVEVDEDGSQYITAGGVEYQVSCIYREPGIKGRGTVCYHGVSLEDQSEVVIKDSWVDVCNEQTEVDVLNQLNERDEKELCTPDGVRVIPQIVSHEILKTKRPGIAPGEWVDVEATTALFRHHLVEWDGDSPKWAWTSFEKSKRSKVEIRKLCRIVMKPFGQGLDTFTSKKELVRAFGDIVYAVEILRRNGIVHRDISFRNILLHKHEGVLRGLLIDYDCAVFVDRSSSEAIAERIGTLPFMAYDRMMKIPDFPHSYFHDLESIFYVICSICIRYSGPRSQKRDFESENLRYQDTAMAKWNGDGRIDPTIEDLACFKLTSIFGKGVEETVDQFSSYFDDIKGFARSYGALIFKNYSSFLSEKCLKEFEEKRKDLVNRIVGAASSDETKILKRNYNKLPIHLRPASVVIDSLIGVVDKAFNTIAEEVDADCDDDDGVSTPRISRHQVNR